MISLFSPRSSNLILAQPPVEQKQIGPTEAPQPSILIVDDVPDNIRFLSAFLTNQGFEVRKAINGRMALRTIDTLIPNLILLDVNLPDISGYEVCQQLKDNSSTASIPIIFLSASSEAIDKVKAFKLGAADYITKPFQLTEVLARIQTQLTIQNLQKEREVQNEQLKQALSELKAAQANLVQQETMATLRKVVAGVAHEINNPLSFISCNIRPTQEYIDHLLQILRLYQQQYPASDPAIAAYLKEIDLEFLTSDLTNILASMGRGAERIHAVVLALRNFIRLDESGIKPIDLHESINNILALLQHRLVSKDDGTTIRVMKEFGERTLVTCQASQINQVLFNLLCNAIDAIEKKISHSGDSGDQPLAPEISISTRLIDNLISVQIKDNGVGIATINQAFVFEPFFTTKPAGCGVGLGLATSRRIVEELHGGSLTYESSWMKGTTFTIQLPISSLDHIQS